MYIPLLVFIFISLAERDRVKQEEPIKIEISNSNNNNNNNRNDTPTATKRRSEEPQGKRNKVVTTPPLDSQQPTSFAEGTSVSDNSTTHSPNSTYGTLSGHGRDHFQPASSSLLREPAALNHIQLALSESRGRESPSRPVLFSPPPLVPAHSRKLRAGYPTAAGPKHANSPDRPRTRDAAGDRGADLCSGRDPSI